MNKGRFRSKLAAMAISAALPAVTLAVALASPMAQAAPAAVTGAKCQVNAVLASKDPGGVDRDLQFLEDKLKDDEFAAYHSFHRLEMKDLELKLREETTANFASGHKVGLTLLGGSDNRLELKLSLTKRDGEGALLDTRYGIDSGGILMVRAGAFTHNERTGKLFFAIQCTG